MVAITKTSGQCHDFTLDKTKHKSRLVNDGSHDADCNGKCGRCDRVGSDDSYDRS